MKRRNVKVSYDVIMKVKEGSMAAIESVMESYQGEIELMVRAFASWLTEEMREDCRQEASIGLIKLLRKMGSARN